MRIPMLKPCIVDVALVLYSTLVVCCKWFDSQKLGKQKWLQKAKVQSYRLSYRLSKHPG